MEIAAALVGRRIDKYEIEPNRERIHFDTDAGRVTMRTDGDCCSQTWIESLDDPDALLGTVTAIENIEMPNLGNVATPWHQDVDEVAYYGLKITTEKGRCVIDYRNDSNGYYGGSLEVIASP